MVADDPYPIFTILLQTQSILNPELSSEVWFLIGSCFLLIFLIICSAFFSASENALFSLSQNDLEDIRKNETPRNKAVIKLLSQPKKLLATILTANNFVNVTFVIVSSLVLETIFNSELKTTSPILYSTFEVAIVTFLLLLFGEMVPKVYSIKRNLAIARLMAIPILVTQKIFAFIVIPMVKFTTFIDKRVKKHEHSVSADELSHAIDITADSSANKEEKAILKGIVNFGNKTVRQIMKNRGDVSALNYDLTFPELLIKINELGYSRLPVYEDNFDNIKGIIYIKELLPYITDAGDFNWKNLMKPAFFVPDNKRIDLLLEEFQEQRMHMAIVVDEYGGKLGIVTMEDILEEIFGEINDEFDEEPLSYSKIDDNTYVIEGKFLINDFCKILNIDSNFFDEVKGEAETVAGMLLELAGKIPNRGETIKYLNFSFTVESVDNRRIKRIKVDIS
ncbi:MAG: gliding motility-associated protein GldE [Bacteroidota bacterium]